MPTKQGDFLKVNELALLRLMHSRISPNTFSMEHYTRVFSVFLTLERASLLDVCQLSGLDRQSVEYLLKNLEQTRIIECSKKEFKINLKPEKLFEMMQPMEEKKCTTTKNPTAKPAQAKNSQLLVCTSQKR